MIWSGLDIAVVPDGQVLLFTLGVSAAVALAFGVAPLRVVAGIPVTYELHTFGNPKMLIPEAAKVLHEIDPNLPVEKPITQ